MLVLTSGRLSGHRDVSLGCARGSGLRPSPIFFKLKTFGVLSKPLDSLSRIWDACLAIGMLVWAVLVVRGFAPHPFFFNSRTLGCCLNLWIDRLGSGMPVLPSGCLSDNRDVRRAVLFGSVPIVSLFLFLSFSLSFPGWGGWFLLVFQFIL